MEIFCQKRQADAGREKHGAGGNMKAAREVNEANEANEANEVKDENGGVAAFFDLDGTLVALPSLERRFIRILRYRREIPAKNLFLWLGEALRLMPRGIGAILQANKMYLRGVQILDERGERDGEVSSWHKDGHQARGQGSALPSKRARCNPRLPVPRFFPQAIERVVWHARQGHEIVLLSGTLEPLARAAAQAMAVGLGLLGVTVKTRVCATRLEGIDGKWTGRISSEALFGEAKVRAAKRLAEELQLDLQRCYAYGDSLNDRWLLAGVGNPAAVNPLNDLASLARTRGWPVLHWERKENPTQKHRTHRETTERNAHSRVLA
jgi:HAD superfamily phosphoserine phosphatase-like hydrolase